MNDWQWKKYMFCMGKINLYLLTIESLTTGVILEETVLKFLNADLDNKQSIWEAYLEYLEVIDLLSSDFNFNPKRYEKSAFFKFFNKNINAIYFINRTMVNMLLEKPEQKEIDEFIDDTPTIKIIHSFEPRKKNLLNKPELIIDNHVTPITDLWISFIRIGYVKLCLTNIPKIRKCAASDCSLFFIKTPRGHGQKYCSVRCQNRIKKREWLLKKKENKHFIEIPF